nr:ATP-binding protein [Candidatus Freyarchaeota archaeon]
MSYHQKLIEEVVGKIENRRNSYGSVLVKSTIVKQDSAWKNSVTKILPLHKSETYVTKEKLDYGNFVLFEELISLDNLIEIIRKLPEKGTATITLGDYEVQVEGEGLQDGYEYDSGEEYLSIGWSFERYHYRSPSRIHPKEPIVSKDLPLFPNFQKAVNERIGIDIVRYSELYSIVICLPKYEAKIEEVNIGSTEIRVKVQPRDTNIENLIGKLYCERENEVKHVDIEFKDKVEITSIGFKPDFLYIILMAKTDNEVLDSRRYSSRQLLPKGVVIDIPEYGIRELIRNGETETVEFKENIGKPEEFVETVVAFANSKGGIIILGVDDHSKVIGVSERFNEDTITNILRSHCEPQIKCEIIRRQLDEKEIVIIRVEEGRDKPYILKDKGVYIRANATDRISNRYELDEMYRQKQLGYRS